MNFTNGESRSLNGILPVAGNKVLQSVCLASTILVITGCASSTKQANTAAPDNYFAMSLPDMPGGHDLMMSPADHSTTLLDYGSSSTSAAVRQALLAQHQRWVGTPYRLGGTNERGIDCSALIQNVYRDTFNVQLPRTTRQQVKQGRQVDRSELQPGDLVFFNPPGVGRHAGIYIGSGRFMHASSSKGVMISRLDNSYWQRYYWQSRRTLEPTHLAGLADSLQR
ncbi:glycoside hydrolase [Halomonas sp. TBZ9]|uniref:Glycoside hydrolase n=2 Tax=Vreelandella azerica TaxID=2732867 RepID=A0A7Y3XA48_9GAMM|nr:glycoside hydrolase [Halomonas azerica]